MNPLIKSLLLLAIICPFYIAIIGTCCNKCSDPGNPCTPACYSPESPCPDPALAGYLRGKECSSGSTLGQCKDAQCIQHECDSKDEFDYCAYPRDLSQGPGICISGHCVSMKKANGDPDPCVIYGIGRINCCSDAGCLAAFGSRCPPTEMQSSGSCDTSGVDPNDPLAGRGGTCNNGYCAAGDCEPPPNPLPASVPVSASELGTCVIGQWNGLVNVARCKTDFCDPANGSCRHVSIFGVERNCGINNETCKENLPALPLECSVGESCGYDCDTNQDDCVVGTCDEAKLKRGGACPDGICCTYENKVIGVPCTNEQGEAGKCDSAGVCLSMCGP